MVIMGSYFSVLHTLRAYKECLQKKKFPKRSASKCGCENLERCIPPNVRRHGVVTNLRFLIFSAVMIFPNRKEVLPPSKTWCPFAHDATCQWAVSTRFDSGVLSVRLESGVVATSQSNRTHPHRAQLLANSLPTLHETAGVTVNRPA